MSKDIVYRASPKISLLVLVLIFVFLVVLLYCAIHMRWGLILVILLLPILIQLPVGYNIFEDRIEIKCLLKTWRIPYKEIFNVKPCSSSAIFIGISIKPLLSFKNLIWIERSKGLPFIISLENRDKFINNLNDSMKRIMAK